MELNKCSRCGAFHTNPGDVCPKCASKDSLEYDLNFIIENGIDEYLKQQENKKNKDTEFIELFKQNYDEIVKIMKFDPHKRVPVNCYTCIKGMDLSKQYGKSKIKE